MKKLLLFSLVCLVIFSNATAQKYQWYRGNTHFHSLCSDGDSPLKTIITWYHDKGYDFVVTSDHNITSLPDTMDTRGFRDDFLIIPGCEVTYKSAHCTAVGVRESLIPQELVRKWNDGSLKGYAPKDDNKESQSFLLQVEVNGILNAGGLPIINHPNFAAGITEKELANIEGVHHIEIFNAHPKVFNFGKERHNPVEQKWDYLLSRGAKIYGIAADDAHRLKTKKANPGQAWIMVKAKNLNEKEIINAVRKGDFYASTGVMLKKYEVKKRKIELEIDSVATMQNLEQNLGVGSKTDKKVTPGYLFEVITREGRVIHTSGGTKLTYNFTNNLVQQYCRVKITFIPYNDTRSWFAWTQPVFIE